ncbi:hypothetical protein G7017_11015 [Pseudomonas fulva]|uniref:hypothetical protein n=1 Tax=Pseudomonas putida group TaxID=136845 RepID=UPI0007716F79|nr:MULTISPECIES: hypothetical protein [Pseudomonas putida group]KWW12856.1 hypothetical protein AS889_20880 [Pseudomonas putida]MBA1221425.1 hypothetical protein [Pseudomonas fulva]MBH3452072.1 hypothetical protein [Pseudomonas putida]MDQ2486784.1 hypothetical protein [Pseudomonas putida]
MRVPIYPRDVESSRRGFNSIKKVIKKNWPGLEPILLSHAAQTLAICFGYQSIHEIHKEVDRAHLLKLPPLEDTWAQSLRVVMKALRIEVPVSDAELSKLVEFVRSWPLKYLTAYQEAYSKEEYDVARSNAGLDWAAEINTPES